MKTPQAVSNPRLQPAALAVVALFGACFAPRAAAYEAGDWIVRGGATVVTPDVSNSALRFNNDGLNTALGSQKVDIDNNTQLGLTVTYMYNSYIGFELLAATPFKHDIQGKGALSTALRGIPLPNNIAEVTHLPPTLSVVYYPLQGFDFQPYVGAGVNYTFFFSEDSNIGGKVDLDSSVGVALQVGADYRLSDRWHVNASVRWIDIETDAKFTGTNLPGGNLDTTVDIDPIVYSVMLGYTF